MDIEENVHFCSGELLGKPVSPVWGFLLYFHYTMSVRRDPEGYPGVRCQATTVAMLDDFYWFLLLDHVDQETQKKKLCYEADVKAPYLINC